MQVSAVCANNLYSIDVSETKFSNDAIQAATDLSSGTFTSNVNKCDSDIDMESIFEWKNFCQTQILANNLDYIA